MIYEQGGYIKLSELECIAFALRTNVETLKSLINDFDLFKKDEKQFWSTSVLKRLELREEKSRKAREAAEKRWNPNGSKTKPKCDCMENECECSAIKGEESEIKDIYNTLSHETELLEYKFFGEFQQVRLTEQEYQDFTGRCLSEKLADELIQQLDNNLKSGKDEVKIGGHFARLCTYLNQHYKKPYSKVNYGRKNPEDKENYNIDLDKLAKNQEKE